MSVPASRDSLKTWCLNNKYTKWYFSIIDRAILRNWNKKTAETYVEKHHILPKSIFNNDDTVYLTAREHFVCHLILPKILKEDSHKRKMKLAIHRMMFGNKQSVYCKSSKIYELVKNWHSDAAKDRSVEYWKKIPQDQRSLMRKGEKNGRYGKLVSEETRNKISKSNKGKLSKEKHPLWKKGHSEKTKQKMSSDTLISERNKGKNNPMYGKTGAAKNKKWYHDKVNRIEKYFIPGFQPKNYTEGRLSRVNS